VPSHGPSGQLDTMRVRRCWGHQAAKNVIAPLTCGNGAITQRRAVDDAIRGYQGTTARARFPNQRRRWSSGFDKRSNSAAWTCSASEHG
jgi:hypothetical protein